MFSLASGKVQNMERAVAGEVKSKETNVVELVFFTCLTNKPPYVKKVRGWTSNNH